MSTTTDITISFFDFLQYQKRYSLHTLTSYKNDLSQFQIYLKDAYELEEIAYANFSMIRGWLVDLVEKENTAKTINRKIASLRSFYKFLLKNEVIEKDPMLKIKAPKLKKSLPIYVAEPDILKLLDQFEYPDGFPGIRDKLIFELLYGTGIRLSELLSLKLSDINLPAAQIKVTGKGNKQRIIPVNKALIQLLKSYMLAKAKDVENSVEELIVTDRGDKAYPVFIYRKVKEYLSDITTIEKKSPHVLRHTFATHLLNKGADLNAIKDLLGHSSLAATQVYTHNSLEKIKAIFDQAHPKA